MTKKEILDLEDKILNPLTLINYLLRESDTGKEQVKIIENYIRGLKPNGGSDVQSKSKRS